MFTKRGQPNNMNDITIIQEALEQLEVLAGIKGTFRRTKLLDGEVDFLVRGGRHVFAIEVKYEPRPYQLPQFLELAQKYGTVMVIANYIVPTLKEQLRQHKIAYLDRGGNFYLDTGDSMVWIEGQKPPPKDTVMVNRAFTKTGLRVVFHLLLHPEDVNKPYRYLAKQTRTALGNVTNVFKALKESGYLLPLDKKRFVLQRRKALLQRWVGGWGDILKPTLLKGSYRFWKHENFTNWGDLAIKGDTVWGGEGAAENLIHQLTPGKLTLYTKEESGYYGRTWTLLPDSEGQLKIYEKFWDEHVGNFAPPLLVYADLLLENDPRCQEAAELVFNQYLKDEFKW